MPNYSFINLDGHKLKVGSWLFQDFRWSTDKKHQKLMGVLGSQPGVFSDALTYLDRNNRILGQILTTLNNPICNRSNLVADQNYLLKHKIEELLSAGCLRKSTSPFSSPVCVQYVGDKMEMNVDYFTLNEHTIPRNYDLPSTQVVLLQINESNLFSKIVLKDPFHQISLADGSMAKTAFATDFGTYEFTTMHRGMKNAEDFLQMLMDDVLLNADKRFIKNHQGEILIHTTNFDHQIELLAEILREINEANLKIDPAESVFAVSHVKFLGWIISSLGIMMDWEMSSKIANYVTPLNKQQVNDFLGLIEPYQCFVANYSATILPLRNLMQSPQFYWGMREQNSFDSLKQRIITAPPIPFRDASQTAPLYAELPL